KIKHAQLRGPRPPPCCRPCQLKVRHVQSQHHQRHHILRVKIRGSPGLPVRHQKSQRRSHRNRNQSQQHARVAHPLQQFQRRQSPHHVAQFPYLQNPFLR